MWRRASASEQDVIGHYSYTQYYRSHFQIIKSCESNEDQRSQTSREGTTLRWPHIVGIFLLGHLSVLEWYLGLTRVQGLCWKKRDQQSFYNLQLHWWAAVHGVAKSRTRLSATSLSLFTFMHWRRKWQPTPVFLPGEAQGRRSLLGAVYGVTQSRTRLTRLSSSSSSLLSDICYANIFPVYVLPIYFLYDLFW